MDDGKLTIIYGTMFSGKTEELHRIKRRAESVGFTTQLFKPKIDRRFSETDSVSHSKSFVEAIPIGSLDELEKRLDRKAYLYLFDEWQFFTAEFNEFIISLVFEEQKNVAVAGLNVDYRGELFLMKNLEGKITTKSIYDLENIAHEPIHIHALCTYPVTLAQRCGKQADYCQRFLDEEKTKIAPFDAETVELGAKEKYEPRCPEHFVYYEESRLWLHK
ncbi:hypothetical protein HQ533_02590 [Candidatus Woesearchaeota archaeon]|nr:hypothetical protein [Candidatus Woesearchaeota archaeon]